MKRAFVRRWCILGAVIVSSGITAMRTDNWFFAFVFWFLVLFCAVNISWAAYAFAFGGISVRRHAPNRLDEDDEFIVETTLRNESLFPLVNVGIEDELSCAAPEERHHRYAVGYLAPHTARTVRYRCICYLRGYYPLGPMRVYFFDPFGFFFFCRTFASDRGVYVYPRTFSIRAFPPLRRGVAPWFGIETSRISGDEDEFFGVREYRPGDPIKRIHWLLTARKNNLIVKQYQRQSFYRTTILFSLEKARNYGEGKQAVAEYMIKIAASVARYLIQQGVAVELLVHTGEFVQIPSNKGPEHLENILRFFSMAKVESQMPLRQMFQEASRHIPDDTTVIVLMLDEDWDYLIRMLHLDRRNTCLIPLILVASTFKYQIAPDEVALDVKVKLSREFNFAPLVFFRGQPLAQVFERGSI